ERGDRHALPRAAQAAGLLAGLQGPLRPLRLARLGNADRRPARVLPGLGQPGRQHRLGGDAGAAHRDGFDHRRAGDVARPGGALGARYRRQASVTQDVVALYEQSLAKRGFVSDPAQWRAVERLQRLYEEWSAYKAKRSNALKRLLVHPDLPKGVYLWGPVGRGKSFLMDAFFLCTPLVRKRRVHFHHFMREIHRELDELRGTEDPLAAVAEKTARRYRLICFDEFH